MSEERQRVAALYQALLESWNRRDAETFAAQFTVAGSAVGFDGSQMNGRAEIAATLSDIFRDHPTGRYVAKIREIRSLARGVTLLRAVTGLISPGKTDVNPATNAVQSVVAIREDGADRIALLQNTPAALHGRPHLAEALTVELNEVAHSDRLVASDSAAR